MSENNNLFEEFIKKFFIKFGKLLIEGFHTMNPNYGSTNAVTSSRLIKTVSPAARSRGRHGLFNVNPRIKNAYGLNPQAEEQFPHQELD